MALPTTSPIQITSMLGGNNSNILLYDILATLSGQTPTIITGGTVVVLTGATGGLDTINSSITAQTAQQATCCTTTNENLSELTTNTGESVLLQQQTVSLLSYLTANTMATAYSLWQTGSSYSTSILPKYPASNGATSQYSFIGGGESNSVSGNYSTILNGSNNVITGAYSSVLAGLNHSISANNSAIIGGNGYTLAINNTVLVPALMVVNVPTFDTDTDAGNGGLTAGQLYRSISAVLITGLCDIGDAILKIKT